MNRQWVLDHLKEAFEELSRTISELESTTDYCDGEFLIAMRHIYHHLNTAWNSRESSETTAGEDFFSWRRFPTDIEMD
jgi:hypothetical protein